MMHETIETYGDGLEKYFDGYNTVKQLGVSHHFEFVQYIKDKWYSGGDDVFAVRLRSSLEDIDSFKTMKEASQLMQDCLTIYARHGYNDKFFDNLFAYRKARKENAK